MALQRQEAQVVGVAEGRVDVEEEVAEVKVVVEGEVEDVVESKQPQPPDPGLAFPLVARSRMAPCD